MILSTSPHSILPSHLISSYPLTSFHLTLSLHTILPPHFIPSYPITSYHPTPSLHTILPPHFIPSYPLTSFHPNPNLIPSYPLTSFHHNPNLILSYPLTSFHPTNSPHFNVKVTSKNAMNDLEDQKKYHLLILKWNKVLHFPFFCRNPVYKLGGSKVKIVLDIIYEIYKFSCVCHCVLYLSQLIHLTCNLYLKLFSGI